MFQVRRNAKSKTQKFAHFRLDFETVLESALPKWNIFCFLLNWFISLKYHARKELTWNQYHIQRFLLRRVQILYFLNDDLK